MNQQLQTIDLQKSLSTFNEFDAQLVDLEGQFAGVVYDMDDDKQNKQARSDKRKLGSVKSALDDAHKSVKAPIKKMSDQIDATRKRIKDRIIELQDGISKQIKTHEEKLQAHQDMLDGKVAKIREFALFQADHVYKSDDLKTSIETLEKIDIDETYEDRAAEAMVAKKESLKVLNQMFENISAREAEQAELEARRKADAEREQKEREEKAAQEAAEKAKREAEEKAEAERKRLEEQHQAELKAKEEENQRKAAEEEQKAKRQELYLNCRARLLDIANGLIDGSPALTAELIHEIETIGIGADYGEYAEELCDLRDRTKESLHQKAQQEEQERAERAKKADEQHRRSVECRIESAIDDVISKSQEFPDPAISAAEAVVKAIKLGEIPHVKIEY